eukprot:jgi/Psemu1/325781/estExt_fgenesh1_pg.C_2850001
MTKPKPSTAGDDNDADAIVQDDIEIENANENENENNSDENNSDEFDYIFGFGSIMNRGTHGENLLPGVAVVLSCDFGYERQWNFRSSTGFTALGVTYKKKKVQGNSDNHDQKTTATGGMDINGVLFRVTQAMIPVFDRREVGYEKGCLEWGGEPMAEQFLETTGGWSTYFLNDTPSSRRPWLYRKDYSTIDRLLQKHASKTFFGDRKHPEEFASAFHKRMKGTWGLPRRNANFTGRETELQGLRGRFSGTTAQHWPSSPTKQHQQQQQQQGVVKVEVAGMGGVGKTQLVTEYCYRHFPTDYGLVVWLNAESAEALVADYRQLLMDLAQETASSGVMGVANASVNATTNTTLKPTGAGASVAGAAATTTPTTTTTSSSAGAGATPTGDTDEIVREVKTRLFRSQVPWLLVFDNLEDRSLLDIFVPRGAGRTGHILVTTRLVFEMEWDNTNYYDGENKNGGDQDRITGCCGGGRSLLLGCFHPDESVELLRRAAGAANVGGTANQTAATTIASKLGHLPLALGMAAAYMLRCDVPCVEYLERYQSSEASGSRTPSPSLSMSMLRHGTLLPDYSLSVASSLSLSLVAIEQESSVAHDMLRLLCFLGPEQITKPLLRRLMSSENEAQLREASRTRERMQRSESIRALRLSLLVSCGIAVAGLATAVAAGRNRSNNTAAARGVAWRNGAFAAAASLSTASSAWFVASKSRLASNNNSSSNNNNNECPMTERKHGPGKPVTFPSQSAFSATIYEDADSVWNILKSYSLLTVKEGKGSMHRLLAQALRQSQTERDYQRNFRVSLHAMRVMWTFRADEPDTWKVSLPVLDHVKSVVSHIESSSSSSSSLHDSNFDDSSRRDDYDDRLTAGILSIEAGVYSAMALNAFLDAQQSFDLAVSIFDNTTAGDRTQRSVLQKARAEALLELGRVFRYQGKFDESERSLTEARTIYEHHQKRSDPDAGNRIAETLHELGVLEVKKHNLDSATEFLELSLDMRQRNSTCMHMRTVAAGHPDSSNAAHSAATLHQLAAIMVARKPPQLERAKILLQEALGLSRQIGQRAATLKQLARVTIRQGFLDRAERYLEQALDLYMELYGENNKNHINIAAVKFQQGALARQREQWEQAGLHFAACLVIRRNVYAYAKPVGAEDEENPTHLEISCVLHEIARVGFAQSYFTQAIATLQAERSILKRLEETSEHHTEKIYQGRMTNLTWLRKCAKEIGDEDMATAFSNERSEVKASFATGTKPGDGGYNDGGIARQKQTPFDGCSTSTSLQHAAMSCRLATRKLVLERDTNGSKLANLNRALSLLSDELQLSPSGSIKEAATRFRSELLEWKDQPNSRRRAPLLEACDVLRNVFRANGLQVNDSISSRRSRIQLHAVC